MRRAVIGAGEMGHGIAELAALHGHDVTLRDVKQEFLDRGMERIRWSLGKLVDKNQIGRSQMEDALGRIHVTLDLAHACRGADIAIEAVFEDVDLKKRVFQELDEAAPKKTIFASNTSALRITNMASVTKRPATVVGINVLHPLSENSNRPVARSVQTLIDGKKFGRKADEGYYSYKGGRPALRPDMGSGFDPIRILAPMINEAAELVALDVANPAEIDEAMRLGTAFPDGPLAMADKLGIDTVLSALRDHPRSKPATILSEMVARGDLGAKSGKGFYEHRREREMMTQGTLLIAKDPATHVATITINRADSLNTLTPEFFEDFDRAPGE